MDPALSTFDWPDFAPLAEALGGRGVTVRSNADVDMAVRAIAERDRPLLIDVKLDPDQVPWPF
jgi:thiamine pyrophosphate-dependent acetolactate synthase large subunit-like protein